VRLTHTALFLRAIYGVQGAFLTVFDGGIGLQLALLCFGIVDKIHSGQF
jgi:hypothetical protein